MSALRVRPRRVAAVQVAVRLVSTLVSTLVIRAVSARDSEEVTLVLRRTVIVL